MPNNYSYLVSMRALLFIVAAFSVQASLAQPADVAWYDLEEARSQALAQESPILIYVHARWCGPCRLMERQVFPATTTLLRRFVLTRIEFDDHTSRHGIDGVVRSEAAWARHFGIDVPPGFVLMEPDGEVVVRWIGAMRPDAFSRLLAYVATGAHRHATLDRYVQRTSAHQ